MHLSIRRSAQILSFLVCASIFSVPLSGCGGGGDNKGRIVGTVYDGEPGQATAISSGVKITVARFESSGTEVPNIFTVASATTDQNGRFSVSLPPGKYGIWAENGYQFFGGTNTSCTILESVDVTAGQNSTVNLGSKPCSGAFP